MRRVLVMCLMCLALLSGVMGTQAAQTSPLTAGDFTVTVAPGGTATFNLTSLVTGGVQPYSFALNNPPVFAVAAVDRDGELVITADSDASGSDSLTYVVQDSISEGASAQETATGVISIIYAEPQGDPVNPPATPVAGEGGETPVVQLPSTGNGSSASSSFAVLLGAAALLVVIAGGLRRRTCN